jgi:hypothetical protein
MSVSSKGAIQLAVSDQTAVRGDLGAVEFELDPAVENGPQRQLFGFTRHMPHYCVPCFAATS